jgi:hypothetical protein
MADGWNITTHRWQDENDRGKTRAQQQRTTFTVPLFSKQIPRGLPWEGTRAIASSGGQLAT